MRAGTRRRAARCRRASSRNAARASGRRPSSGGSRRRRGRTCRRPPCRRASAHHLERLRRAAPQEELESRRGRELRRPAEAAEAGSKVRAIPCSASASSVAVSGSVDGSQARRVADGLDEPARLLGDVVAPRPAMLPPPRGAAAETTAARGAAPAGSTCRRRTARPGRQEHRHRPAALAGHRHGRVHVERVDIGPLLAVDLDVDEVLVHQRRRRLALERLVRHHVAPVARAVADREQDRPALLARPLERLGAPRIPVDGVVGVLQEVRARLRRRAGSREHRTRRRAVRVRRRAHGRATSRARSRAAAPAGPHPAHGPRGRRARRDRPARHRPPPRRGAGPRRRARRARELPRRGRSTWTGERISSS